MPIKAGYLLAAGGGAILLYSGIKGHRWGAVARNLISGQKIPSTQELAITSSPQAYAYGSGSGGGGTAPNLGVGGSATKNKAIAHVLTVPYGWSTGAQWNALDRLWTQESGWNNHAQNPTSTAYGIAQFLDSTWATVGGRKTSSASLQIGYGLKYIRQRYGDPIHAEQHEISAGWY
jgi:hypothetical protein